ncbi:MAG: hypothetical protein M9958_03215 [Chitinophagales bacterium]|nr:hypothetical protein [Chitinophagales bacterium]
MSEVNIIKPYGETEINDHAAKVGGRRNLREVSVRVNYETVTTERRIEEKIGGDEFFYLIKKPGRKEVQAVASAGQKQDTDLIQKIMIACVLEGDKSAYEYDGAIYANLLQQISQLIEEAQSGLKKI